MIRFIGCESDGELVPQAIFGRAIGYFTPYHKRILDDLDYFDGALFSFNDEIQFALRHYDGHQAYTVTLYLFNEFTSVDSILEAVRGVISGFELPASAVRWKRGDQFEFGVLPARPDRLLEPEARILALKIAATQPSRAASTTYIKDQVPKYKKLTREDLQPSPSRRAEPIWRKVVGNVKSHHKQASSIVGRGYADLTDDGIRVTEAGLDYLENMGFPVPRAYILA